MTFFARFVSTHSLVIATLLLTATQSLSAAQEESMLNHDMNTLKGEGINLAEKYEGKVVLLVNVASRCGNTPQYKPLQGLHQKFADKGLAVVGVPCNQFGGQEPGSPDEIREFCAQNYGVEFDMLEKVDVNGNDACNLYKNLTSKDSNPEFAGRVTWNFEKFLFNRQGKIVARFGPRVQPDAKEVVSAIEQELATE